METPPVFDDVNGTSHAPAYPWDMSIARAHAVRGMAMCGIVDVDTGVLYPVISHDSFCDACFEYMAVAIQSMVDFVHETGGTI